MGRQDAGRDADGRAVVGYIVGDNGVGADLRMVADMHGTDDLSTRPDEYAVAERRARVAFRTDGDEMLDPDVASSLDGAVDHDTVAMDEDERGTEFRAAPDDASPEKGIQLIEDHRQRCQMVVLCRLHQAVHEHRETAIGQTRLDDVFSPGAAVHPFRLGSEVAPDQRE